MLKYIYQIEIILGFPIWKIADDPVEEAKGCVRYPLPEKWEVIRSYVRNGGARPSYKEAQEIMDELLENLKPENCKVAVTDSRYNLRQPGITLPAVGFDQGSAAGNGWIYGNAFGYRTEEGMKMPLRPGIKPPQRVVVPTGEPIRDSKAIKDLCVELQTGEQVTYTIRDVKNPSRVSIAARGENTGTLEVRCESLDGKVITGKVLVDKNSTEEYELAVLTESIQWKVTLKAVEGTIQVDEIRFGI